MSGYTIPGVPDMNEAMFGAGDARIKTAVGPTILLQSGSYFDLLDPAGSDFTIEDIAHGLANTCRFAGQCRSFYSVAEHCWHVSRVVSADLAVGALMHDASEAFIGDVTRPLKSLLPAYKTIERQVDAAIAERFGITNSEHPDVKRADLLMLQCEQHAMMPAHADRWTTDTDEAPPPITFGFWQPEEAKLRFLLRFAELTGAKLGAHA